MGPIMVIGVPLRLPPNKRIFVIGMVIGMGIVVIGGLSAET